MSTKYFGDSIYEESLLIGCACKTCMAEIYIYDGPENYNYGIMYRGQHNYKCKRWGDFQFRNLKSFKDFVNSLHDIQYGGSFYVGSYYLRGDYLSYVNNGGIVVENTGDFIEFSRYMSDKHKTKNKSLWNFYISLDKFKMFLKKMDRMVEKATSLEENRFGNFKYEKV